MEKDLITKYFQDNQERFGEVLEQTASYLKCRDLLRPEDIKGKTSLGGRHMYCGDRELYRTASLTEVPISQVKAMFPVCTLQDYHISKGFLLRQSYDSATHQFLPELPKVCLCQEPLNPDLKYFTCPICRVTYHNSCVGEMCPDCKLPIKRQHRESMELDSPLKLQKTNSRDSNSLPLDLYKYKGLTEDSRKNLTQQVRKVHFDYVSIQDSLSHEEKTRQQIVGKIKCALLLAAAEIKQVEGRDFSMQHVDILSISVEAAIYFSNGSKVSSQEYSKKIRSLLFNLTAEKNHDFRGDILRGYISANELCKMQSKDMASSEIKNFRQERQKVYTKEQLILPNSAEKLVIKTHKGEAVFEVDDKAASDQFSTEILDTIANKRDSELKAETDDDPFNPNNYDSLEEKNGEFVDLMVYEIVKEWTGVVLRNKLRDIITQHLDTAQTERILSRINSFSLNKSS